MADEPSKPTGTATATADEGELGEITIPQLLAEAWRDRRSGGLQVSRERTHCQIQVQDGSPIAFESSEEDDGFAALLENAGLIQAADRIKLEAFASKQGCPQASAVLALRMLEAKQLYKGIRMSTRSQLGRVFEWQSGVYRWSALSDETQSKGKPHDILRLIQEQLPTRWGFDRLIHSLMPHIDYSGDISPRFRRITRKLSSASASAKQVIDHLDGSHSLGQVLGKAAGDPIAAATLWVVLHSGIFRIGEKRARTEGDALNVDFEFEVSGGHGPAHASRKTSQDRGDAKARPSANAKAEGLRTEIAEFLLRLAELDHYAALGLSIEATSGEIKRAYFKAAKKFHPDALARIGLADERDHAARVFARIAEAFETLSNDAKRAAYDAGGSDEPEIDTARLAQAETSFRKGEILVRMGNFQGALEYLEPAVDLWPDEPAYQSTLGWALYKKPTPDPARAREHLETASSQAPDDAVILFRLGIVMRALGESDEAKSLIDRARTIEPTVDE